MGCSSLDYSLSTIIKNKIKNVHIPSFQLEHFCPSFRIIDLQPPRFIFSAVFNKKISSPDTRALQFHCPMQCMCAFVYPAFFVGFYFTATCTVRIYLWKKTISSVSFYNKCRINHISTPLSKQGNWSVGMEMGRGKRYFLLIHVSSGKIIVVLFLGELWKSNQPTFTTS